MQIDRDTVIAWTKEYKFIPDLNPDAINALGKSIPIALLEHIAQKATDAEREACAQLCDEQHDQARTSPGAVRADACSRTIRNRGIGGGE